MKKIFMAGFTVIFAFGVLVLFFKLVAVDLLANIFRPLILLIADEWLVVPLTVILTVILIFLVGIPASQIKFQGIIIKLLERMLPKDKRGALVERSKGVYDLVIIIKKKIEFIRADKTTQPLHLVFYPSIPIFWTSALPIGLVEESKLIQITSSLREIYTIIATYGRNAPKIIQEIENSKSIE